MTWEHLLAAALMMGLPMFVGYTIGQTRKDSELLKLASSLSDECERKSTVISRITVITFLWRASDLGGKNDMLEKYEAALRIEQ